MRTNRASLNGLINENGPSLTPTLTKLLSAGSDCTGEKNLQLAEN